MVKDNSTSWHHNSIGKKRKCIQRSFFFFFYRQRKIVYTNSKRKGIPKYTRRKHQSPRGKTSKEKPLKPPSLSTRTQLIYKINQRHWIISYIHANPSWNVTKVSTLGIWRIVLCVYSNVSKEHNKSRAFKPITFRVDFERLSPKSLSIWSMNSLEIGNLSSLNFIDNLPLV